MITQIYSIQTVEEALWCVEAGVDYIGMAADTKSGLPAEVSLERGKEIFAAIGDRAKKVALAVADDPAPIYEAVGALRPDVIHVCGNNYYVTPEFARDVKKLCPGIQVLQAIPMTGPGAIPLAERFGAFCDTLILDSVDPAIAGIGAAGFPHDWAVSAEIVRRVPCHVILAGGLGPENVAEAIRRVRPWGVDSLTRTSLRLPDGTLRKDPEKVRLFVERAHAAAKELGI